MKYKAIVFDIDGTLIDYDYSQYLALSKLMNIIPWKSEQKPDDNAAFDIWFKEKFEVYKRPDSNEIGFYDQQKIILENFLAYYGIISNSAKLSDQLIDNYKSSWRLYPDVMECLLKYKDIPLHIISNGNSDFQRLKLTNTGIETYFVEILISGDIGIKKPDSQIFTTMSERLNLEPQNLIYIGDRLDVDAVAANDAGMKGVWINRKRSADKKLMGSYSENNLPKNISEIYSLAHLDEIIK